MFRFQMKIKSLNAQKINRNIDTIKKFKKKTNEIKLIFKTHNTSLLS